MFDIGWTELLLIGIVALIVIGPEDLPQMFRQLGRFTGKLRAMARDFQRAMDQAAKDTGVSGLAKDVNNIANPKNLGLNAVKEAADKFEKWDPLKPALAKSQPLTPPPMPATPPAAPAATAEPVVAETAAPAKPEGPNTAALRKKRAEKAQILRDTVEKLKAVDTAEAAPAAAPKPAPKRRAKTAVVDVAEAAPASDAAPKRRVRKQKDAAE